MEHTAKHPQQLKKSHHQRQLSCHSDRRDGGHRRTDFPEGLFVEVRTKEEGLTSVYFSATVLPSPKKGSRQKSNKVFVEYHNLLAREDRSDRLKEHVNVSFVRPVPPFQEIVKGFKPNDVVDAFITDGWWIGVVKQVLKNGESFIVTFQDPPDELEVRLEELRVHWDWVDGSWFRPGNQSIEGKMFDVGSKVEVSFDEEERHGAWFPATVLKDLGNGSFVVECNNVSTDEKAQPCEVTISHIRPHPPLLKDTKIRLLDKVDAHIDSGWWSGTTVRVLENSRYMVYIKKTKLQKEFGSCELRPHVDWTDGKWFTGSKEITVRSSDGRMHVHQTPENLNASTPTFPVNKSGDSEDTRDAKTPTFTSKKGHSQQLTPDNNQKTSDETSSSAIRNQPVSDLRNTLSQSLEKVKEGDVPIASQQDSHHKPVKEVNEILCSPVIPLSVDISATLNATGDQLSDNPLWGKTFQRKQRNVGAATLNGDGKINSTSSPMKKCSMPILQSDIPIPDVGDGNTAEGVQNGKKEETKHPPIIRFPCPKMGSTGHENVRVTWSQCRNSKETTIVSRNKKQKLNGSPVQEIKSMENGKKQTEVIEIEDDVENIPENGTLPFIKSPSLWKEVKSMEGFKKIPEFVMPHFKPLEEFSESAREGMALGHMVTFAYVVEKAFNLQFDDPKSTTDEILKMLKGLEENGFDCKIVQDRVKRLLSAKEKEEKLVLELRECNFKISEHNLGKSKADEEILGIKEQISKLQDQMSKLQDKLSSVRSVKEKEESEIASLRARVKETGERIRNLRTDFEGM